MSDIVPTPPSTSPKPKFGVGTVVGHPHFGTGRVVAYESDSYVVLFKGGETKRVAFTFELLKPEKLASDPESDRIRQVVREVLGDYGWLDVDLELGKRWVGGTVKIIPGKDDTKSHEVPIEMFFKKIIGIRDKLRVLEQKINAHTVLTPEEKIELEGYITRCYGSLTTFNSLFANKDSQFRGQSEKE
jgi:hypothetical protein